MNLPGITYRGGILRERLVRKSFDLPKTTLGL